MVVRLAPIVAHERLVPARGKVVPGRVAHEGRRRLPQRRDDELRFLIDVGEACSGGRGEERVREGWRGRRTGGARRDGPYVLLLAMSCARGKRRQHLKSDERTARERMRTVWNGSSCCTVRASQRLEPTTPSRASEGGTHQLAVERDALVEAEDPVVALERRVLVVEHGEEAAHVAAARGARRSARVRARGECERGSAREGRTHR